MMVYSKVGINKHFNHEIVNISLFIGLTIFGGCSKEWSPQAGSFVNPQHIFWFRNKAITLIYATLSAIPARSHTFVEIDHEIISTVILLPSAESFKKGCCQLQAKVCGRSTG